MSASNHESHKKSGSVLEKLGHKISTIKEDIADNLERRKLSQSSTHGNSVHFTSRTHASEDSLSMDKKPPTPPETHVRRTSGKSRKYAARARFNRDKDKRRVLTYPFTFTRALRKRLSRHASQHDMYVSNQTSFLSPEVCKRLTCLCLFRSGRCWSARTHPFDISTGHGVRKEAYQ